MLSIINATNIFLKLASDLAEKMPEEFRQLFLELVEHGDALEKRIAKYCLNGENILYDTIKRYSNLVELSPGSKEYEDKIGFWSERMFATEAIKHLLKAWEIIAIKGPNDKIIYNETLINNHIVIDNLEQARYWIEEQKKENLKERLTQSPR